MRRWERLCLPAGMDQNFITKGHGPASLVKFNSPSHLLFYRGSFLAITLCLLCLKPPEASVTWVVSAATLYPIRTGCICVILYLPLESSTAMKPTQQSRVLDWLAVVTLRQDRLPQKGSKHQQISAAVTTGLHSRREEKQELTASLFV